MKNSQVETEPIYKTLSEIRLRKSQLRTELQQDSNQINALWNYLFHKPEEPTTSGKRITTLMKSSVGVIDGLILGWKLYKKFGGKKGLFSKNK